MLLLIPYMFEAFYHRISDFHYLNSMLLNITNQKLKHFLVKSKIYNLILNYL